MNRSRPFQVGHVLVLDYATLSIDIRRWKSFMKRTKNQWQQYDVSERDGNQRQRESNSCWPYCNRWPRDLKVHHSIINELGKWELAKWERERGGKELIASGYVHATGFSISPCRALRESVRYAPIHPLVAQVNYEACSHTHTEREGGGSGSTTRHSPHSVAR